MALAAGISITSAPRSLAKACWIKGLSDIQKPIHTQKKKSINETSGSLTNYKKKGCLTVEKTFPKLEKFHIT